MDDARARAILWTARIRLGTIRSMILRGLLPLALLLGSTSCSATWEGMQADAGDLFGGSREPETAATRPASVESVVMEAQKALAERGYDVGAPDGLVGPRTTRAIFAYQRDHDLPRTGYVDDELLESLRRGGN